MFSPIIVFAFAAGLISFGSGLDERSANEAILKCFKSGWEAEASDMSAHGGHPDSSTKIEESCIFIRVRLALFDKKKRRCYRSLERVT